MLFIAKYPKNSAAHDRAKIKKMPFYPHLNLVIVLAFVLSCCFPSLVHSNESTVTVHAFDEDENFGKNLDNFPSSEIQQDVNNLSSTNNSSDPAIDVKASQKLMSSSNSTEDSDEYDEDELSWEDGNWRRKDKSKVAAVVVYSSVILIALFGILVKYFVTQYETLQAKAHLEYQQLRNVQCHS